MSKFSFIDLRQIDFEYSGFDSSNFLEGFTFFEVVEVCFTRELDTDIEGSCRELEGVSHGGFVGELVVAYVHTRTLILMGNVWTRTRLACTLLSR